MRLEDLRPAPGATHSRKRLGRGPSSGQGKTAGKGSKGQKSRSGGGASPGFEGGQMPLYRRLPKRGFLPHGGKTEYAIVNLKSLGKFAANSVVDPEALVRARLVKNGRRGLVKILGTGEVAHALTVKVHAISESAKAKIEAKGGRVEVLGGHTEKSAS
ncbi:MAG: 50S ribosomal protein L15 [Candidatus Rokubacteria bacterium]|nr:50S ribosomal protein L15 [Candidatus Rokubacteria bacterium]